MTRTTRASHDCDAFRCICRERARDFHPAICECVDLAPRTLAGLMCCSTCTAMVGPIACDDARALLARASATGDWPMLHVAAAQLHLARCAVCRATKWSETPRGRPNRSWERPEQHLVESFPGTPLSGSLEALSAALERSLLLEANQAQFSSGRIIVRRLAGEDVRACADWLPDPHDRVLAKLLLVEAELTLGNADVALSLCREALGLCVAGAWHWGPPIQRDISYLVREVVFKDPLLALRLAESCQHSLALKTQLLVAMVEALRDAGYLAYDADDDTFRLTTPGEAREAFRELFEGETIDDALEILLEPPREPWTFDRVWNADVYDDVKEMLCCASPSLVEAWKLADRRDTTDWKPYRSWRRLASTGAVVRAAIERGELELALRWLPQVRDEHSWQVEERWVRGRLLWAIGEALLERGERERALALQEEDAYQIGRWILHRDRAAKRLPSPVDLGRGFEYFCLRRAVVEPPVIRPAELPLENLVAEPRIALGTSGEAATAERVTPARRLRELVDAGQPHEALHFLERYDEQRSDLDRFLGEPADVTRARCVLAEQLAGAGRVDTAVQVLRTIESEDCWEEIEVVTRWIALELGARGQLTAAVTLLEAIRRPLVRSEIALELAYGLAAAGDQAHELMGLLRWMISPRLLRLWAAACFRAAVVRARPEERQSLIAMVDDVIRAVEGGAGAASANHERDPRWGH